MKELTLIETKGDVTFYEDKNGKLFQLIAGDTEPFKVRDGKICYKHIRTINGIVIKYETNGCNGFSLFKNENIMEDNIWTIARATEVAFDLAK